MCGLSGFYSKNFEKFDKKNLENILKHRGPDSFQVYEYKKEIYNLMAFNRLSIIDLNKRSNQPFKFKNLIICFELYNVYGSKVNQDLVLKMT